MVQERLPVLDQVLRRWWQNKSSRRKGEGGAQAEGDPEDLIGQGGLYSSCVTKIPTVKQGNS